MFLFLFVFQPVSSIKPTTSAGSLSGSAKEAEQGRRLSQTLTEGTHDLF